MQIRRISSDGHMFRVIAYIENSHWVCLSGSTPQPITRLSPSALAIVWVFYTNPVSVIYRLDRSQYTRIAIWGTIYGSLFDGGLIRQPPVVATAEPTPTPHHHPPHPLHSRQLTVTMKCLLRAPRPFACRPHPTWSCRRTLLTLSHYRGPSKVGWLAGIGLQIPRN